VPASVPPFDVLHVEPLRVAWVDTDAGGRIHWSAVFRWAELAEHAFYAVGRETSGKSFKRCCRVSPPTTQMQITRRTAVERKGRNASTMLRMATVPL
jgi:hypothetical protein